MHRYIYLHLRRKFQYLIFNPHVSHLLILNSRASRDIILWPWILLIWEYSTPLSDFSFSLFHFPFWTWWSDQNTLSFVLAVRTVPPPRPTPLPAIVPCPHQLRGRTTPPCSACSPALPTGPEVPCNAACQPLGSQRHSLHLTPECGHVSRAAPSCRHWRAICLGGAGCKGVDASG